MATLKQDLVKIDSLQHSGTFPAFTAAATDILEVYRLALKLSETKVSRFNFIGNGFGVKGAMNGMADAGLVKVLTGAVASKTVNALAGQLQEVVADAGRQVELLRSA